MVAQCVISNVTINIEGTAPFCPGETITLSTQVSGGSPPYTYEWATGQITQSITIVTQGLVDLVVIVTDANGCQGVGSVHIKSPVYNSNLYWEPFPACGSDSLLLNLEPSISGGSGANLTYAWSNGGTTQDVYATASGTYTVTMTDTNTGCTLTDTATVVVVPNPLPNVEIIGPSLLCPGQSATLSASGGPYNYYYWSPGGVNSATFTANGPGIYEVVVQNANWCVGIDTLVILPGNAVPILNAPTPICSGQSTTVEVVNASQFTTFSWSNGGNGPTVSVNTPGTYTVTVSAGGNCTATASVEVLSAGSSIALSGASLPVTSCVSANGTIDLSVSPSGTYDFSWSNGQISEDLSNLAAGSYTVTVTEVGGCTASASFAVSNNTTPPVAIATPVPATCGQENGSIDLAVTPPGSYSFIWSNGQTSQHLNNVSAGTYDVTVTDGASGCTAAANATVDNNNLSLFLSGSVQQPSGGQNNGAIDINISPTGTYIYNWSNGATTEDLTALSTGSYSVTVSAGTCTTDATFILNANNCLFGAEITPSLPQWSVLCPGQLLTLTATPFNATPPYTYQWSNGQTTPSISLASPIPGGITTVLITDANGCTGSDWVHLKYFEWTATIYPETGTQCNGETMYLNASLFPNEAGSSYAWSTGETDQTLFINSNGTYSVTVTNPNMPCTVSTTIVVDNFVNAPQPDPSVTGPATLCPGQTATVTAVGGPFATYVWAPTYASETANLPITDPGTYTVYVTNAEGCEGVDSIVVLPGSVAPELNAPTPICSGQSTTVEVVNASQFTTFSWSNGGNGPTVSVNTPGTYTVTVSAGGNCTATASVEVLSAGSSIALAGASLPVTSCVSANGTIDLSVSPSGTYDFSWSNGQISEDLSNLAAGSYAVTVTEVGGCTASASFAVANNTTPPVATATPVPATCGQENGSIDLTVSPTGIYTYAWSNGATTEDLPNVPAGTYSITVTEVTSGCSTTASALIADANIPLFLSGNLTQPSNGQNNGAINLNTSPAGTYSYNWSNGASTEDLSGLGAGTYSVTVSAGGSCTQTATFVLVSSNNCQGFSVLGGIDNGGGSYCIGTTLLLLSFPSGGTQPYSYQWSTGGSGQNESITVTTNNDVFVTVTDAAGCQVVAMIHLKPLLWQEAVVVGAPACEGQPITMQVDPDQFWYEYVWSTGATTAGITVTAPGTYTVTITDAGAGCSKVISATPSFLTAPSVSIAGPTTLCLGQTATLDALGGTFSNYLWSPGGQATPSISVTGPGTYGVTVSESSGCPGSSSIEVLQSQVTPPIIPPPSLLCPGETASIAVANSAAYAAFLWNTGEITPAITTATPGLYTVTVTESSGCTATGSVDVAGNPISTTASTISTPSSCGQSNGAISLAIAPPGNYGLLWSNGQTLQNLTGLTAGNYTVTITDPAGCTITTSADVLDNSFTPILAGNISPNTSCNSYNGSINLNASPSNSYNYIWSNGAVTEDISNLPAGLYYVTVSAGGNCSATANFEVPDNAELPILTIFPSASSCGQSNGGINITTSPAATYTFAWSNGANSEDLSDIQAGTYTATVTSTNGCTAIATTTVPDNSPTIFLSGIASPNSNCGQSNGSIDLTTSPSGSYTYTWSNGANSEDLSGISGGTYSITVSAGGNCSATTNFTVPTAANVPSIVPVTSPATCGQANGSIDLTIMPPANYSIVWSNGAVSEDLQSLSAGNYTVTVSDTNNCTVSTSITVIDNGVSVVLSGTVLPNTACTSNNGSIDLSTSPTGTYSFVWSNGANSEDLQNLSPGTYFVTVSQSPTCASTASYIIENASNSPVLSAFPLSATCGQPNGSIDLSVTPTGGHTYLWSNGAVTEDLQDIVPGYYTVTCTDINGCMASTTVELLNGNTSFAISAVPTASTSCISANGQINLTISPSGTYNFLWSNGEVMEDLTNIPTGTYTATVTDASGCSDMVSATVGGAALPQVAIGGPAAACEGGSATLIADAGFTTYSWSNGSTAPSITITQSANYTVTVSDANGCTAMASHVFEQLPLPMPTIEGPSTICGGTTDFVVSGGVFDQIAWSTGENTNSINISQPGTYSVTVSDLNGCFAAASKNLLIGTSLLPVIVTDNSSCNGTAILDAGAGYASYQWSNGSIFQNTTVSSPGQYSVTVTDGSGCTGQDLITISLPALPQVMISGLSSVCNGTSTELSVPEFAQTAWNTGESNSSITIWQSGNYIVTVTDMNGCTATDSLVVTVGSGLQPNISPTLSSCDGTTTLDVGTGYASYLWSNGDITPSITVNFSGTYAVTVSDINGCTGSAVENLQLPAPPTAQVVGATGLCEGEETVLAAPGNFAQYLWNTGETTSEITITQGGTYSVTVSDDNGCTAYSNWTVATLTSSFSYFEMTTCSPQDTGTVQALFSNQFGCDSVVVTNTLLTPPFTASIQLLACADGSAEYNGVSIPTGTSQSFAFDAANGCDSVVTVSVAPFQQIDFQLLATPTCWNSQDGTVSVSMLSGEAPYRYALDGGGFQLVPLFTGMAGGGHEVIVEDANGCEKSLLVHVPQSSPSLLLADTVTIACGEGTAVLRPQLVTAAPDEAIWQWQDGSSLPSLQVDEAGTYMVKVDDGCEVLERSIEVRWDPEYQETEFFYIPNCFSPNGDGINDDFRVFPSPNFEMLSFEFRIFDRWGDEMFVTFDPSVGWNGVYREIERQPAVYVWFVKAKVLVCGKREVMVFREGGVTIIR